MIKIIMGKPFVSAPGKPVDPSKFLKSHSKPVPVLMSRPGPINPYYDLYREEMGQKAFDRIYNCDFPENLTTAKEEREVNRVIRKSAGKMGQTAAQIAAGNHEGNPNLGQRWPGISAAEAAKNLRTVSGIELKFSGGMPKGVNMWASDIKIPELREAAQEIAKDVGNNPEKYGGTASERRVCDVMDNAIKKLKASGQLLDAPPQNNIIQTMAGALAGLMIIVTAPIWALLMIAGAGVYFAGEILVHTGRYTLDGTYRGNVRRYPPWIKHGAGENNECTHNGTIMAFVFYGVIALAAWVALCVYSETQ